MYSMIDMPVLGADIMPWSFAGHAGAIRPLPDSSSVSGTHKDNDDFDNRSALPL